MNIFDAVERANPNGIAIEALIQAEMEYMSADYDAQEVYDILNPDSNGFTKMAYKDDEGYWRVTGSNKKYDEYDDLYKDYPDLC